ncbi:MAG: phosphonate ABC transporter ATP-binding protein [Microbacteriaceae bacterium]
MILFKNVNKIYPNGVQGLKDINLEIAEGEFVSIIGLSGAGKSTLLRSINRLNEISSGEIIIQNDNISTAKGQSLRQIRRKIGMIFQGFNLVGTSSVQKNVIVGRLAYYSVWRSLLGLFSKEDYELVNNALIRVNLLEKLHTRADQLSGGQQQRVAIARALVQQPTILLADEPVASLDPITTDRIMKDLKKISSELNLTVVTSLHSVELARNYSTRIIGMSNGVVVFDGTPEEATDAKLGEIYGEEYLRLSNPEAEVDA